MSSFPDVSANSLLVTGTSRFSGPATFAGGVTFGNGTTASSTLAGNSMTFAGSTIFNGPTTFASTTPLTGIKANSITLTGGTGGQLTYTDASGLLVNDVPVGSGITEVKSSNGSGITVEPTQSGGVSLSSNLTAGAGISIDSSSGDTSKTISSNLTAGQGIAVDVSGSDITISSFLEEGPGISIDASGAALVIRANGSGSASDWSTFRASSTVDLSGNSIVSSGDITIDASNNAFDLKANTVRLGNNETIVLGVDASEINIGQANASAVYIGSAFFSDTTVALQCENAAIDISSGHIYMGQTDPLGSILISSNGDVNIDASGGIMMDASGASMNIGTDGSGSIVLDATGPVTINGNSPGNGVQAITLDAGGAGMSVITNNLQIESLGPVSISSSAATLTLSDIENSENTILATTAAIRLDASGSVLVQAEPSFLYVTPEKMTLQSNVVEIFSINGDVNIDASGGITINGSGSIVLDATGPVTIAGNSTGGGVQAITLDAGGNGMSVENCNDLSITSAGPITQTAATDITVNASGGITMDASGASMNMGTDGSGSIVLNATGPVTINGNSSGNGVQAITLNAGDNGMSVITNNLQMESTGPVTINGTGIPDQQQGITLNCKPSGDTSNPYCTIDMNSGGITVDSVGNIMMDASGMVVVKAESFGLVLECPPATDTFINVPPVPVLMSEAKQISLASSVVYPPSSEPVGQGDGVPINFRVGGTGGGVNSQAWLPISINGENYLIPMIQTSRVVASWI